MKLIAALFTCVVAIFPPSFGQSSIAFDAGTDISVTSGADVCADLLVLDGTFTGDGTRCGAPLPITLASFVARTGARGLGVSLEWKTLSEINNYGFVIQSKRAEESAYADINGSFVAGHGTTLTSHTYASAVSIKVEPQMRFRLKQLDLDGSTYTSESVTLDATNVPETVPKVFALEQNYPNPFNPSTEIRFSVAAPGYTTLSVYNVLGQEIGRIFEGETETGIYYTAHFDGKGLASGLYLARLQSGGESKLRKMILSK